MDCWGYGEEGELGNGSFRNSSLPVPVRGLTNPKAMVAGAGLLRILTTGRVACWGDNEYGELGNGSTRGSGVPVLVANLTDVTAVVSGNEHTVLCDQQQARSTVGATATTASLGTGSST